MNFSRNLLIFLFFSSWCSAVDTPPDCRPLVYVLPKEIDEIVQFARAYRKNLSLPPEEEEIRQTNILRQVYDSLTSYDAYPTLEEAVLAFLADILPLNADNYTVINANLTDLGGKSEDAVYLIRDSNGTLCCVLKAFRKPRKLSSKFLKEISALDLIEQLSMPGVIPIKPLAYARWSNQTEEWGILVETAAKGLRADQFIYELGSLRPKSKKRKAYLKKCQNIFQKIAKALANLHARKSSEAYLLPESNFKSYDKKLKKIQRNPLIVAEIKKRMPFDVFIQYAQKIKTEASNTPVYYSYWHGDAHLTNLFYNDQDETISFIDVANLHLSITDQEEPIFEGTMDLVRVEEYLRRLSIKHLNKQEVTALLKTFYDTYELCSNQKITQSILVFDRTLLKFLRLIKYSSFTVQKSRKKQASYRTVFYQALDYFERQIKLGKDSRYQRIL